MSLKLTIKENSKNYVCTVVQIDRVFDIEGADNIKRVVVFGNNVVVSKDVKEGDTMLYFVSGTKLSAEYCHKNNLYDKAEENYDKEKKGFISFKQRRVKAIKLKGVISDGMLMPLSSLAPFLESGSINSLKIGDEFTDINGNSLCEKYIVKTKERGTAKTKKNGKQPERISRLVENQFFLHGDTDNLRRNIHKINPDDIISIDYKKHGCVSHDTIINTLEYGDLNIKKIVDERLECHIKAYDTNSNEIVYVPIDDYYFKENHGEWYEIELENGQTIKITSNNPVWMPDLKCYREVKDLKVGDNLLFS